MQAVAYGMAYGRVATRGGMDGGTLLNFYSSTFRYSQLFFMMFFDDSKFKASGRRPTELVDAVGPHVRHA
jgi:hypothetical protein